MTDSQEAPLEKTLREFQQIVDHQERWAHLFHLLAEGLDERWINPSQAFAVLAKCFEPREVAGT